MYSKSVPFSEERKELRGFVLSKILKIQEGYLAVPRRPSASASLASLRRSAPLAPGVVPDSWPEELDGFPEDLVGEGDCPSSAESAAHVAITLYAIHQQSQSQPMHVKDWRLGRSVRVLATRTKGESGSELEVPSRFGALVTAESFEEVAHYLRQLVKQLRAQSIPLDYAQLADELLGFLSPARRDKVKLSWGRGFAAREMPPSTDEN